MAAPPERLVSRTAWLTWRCFEAALWVWLLWVLPPWLLRGASDGLAGLVLGAGSAALWLALGACALAIAACWLPPRLYRDGFEQRPDAPALVQAALLAAGAFALGHALALLPPFWVPQRFAFHAEIHRIAAYHAAAAVVGVGCLVYGVRRGHMAQRRWTLGVLPLLALQRSLEPIVLVSRAHLVGFELCALLAMLGCALGVRFPARGRAGWLALSAGCALSSALALFAMPGLVMRGLGKAGASDLAVAAGRLLDVDGDGHATLLGGSDCDPWDARVHPAALEIVRNGRDDNCFGGDLRASPLPPPLAIRASAPKRSLLLVTIDALQARMLEPGPRGRAHMPELTRFATRCAHFARSYVQASYTNDSVGSFMSGQYPMSFSELGQFLGMNPTLAELLRSAGYTTATVNQAAERRTWYGYRGFQQLDIELAARHAGFRAVTAQETTARAIARFDALRAAGRPFLLWVHYMDPHLEYMPHAGTPFAGDGELARYHQEVWSTDRELGRLLRRIVAARFGDEHITVVMADHGEQVAVPGGSGHSWFLSEDVLRTPLVLCAPVVTPGVYDTRVRALDLYPTLLELSAGIRAPSEGAHLRPVWQRKERTDRDVFARSQYRGWSRRAAIVGRYKLHDDVRTGVRTLHDLRGKGEALDVSAQKPEVVEALLQAMGRVWDRSMNDVVLERRGAKMRAGVAGR
jgi:arylsulfatase A-like enzyme